MSKKVDIQIMEDGPIKVSNFDSIKYCGQKLEASGNAFLCRCGESSKAPFCDGTHSKVSFSGKNEIDTPQGIRTWEGKNIKTFFNSNICMHAKFCKPLGGLRKKEVETGDATTAKEIAKVVAACPSGALTYEMTDDPDQSAFNSSQEIEIMEGGEIRIKCEFDGVEKQEQQASTRLTLCRCGLSKNKPFCDASHSEKENFK